MARACTLGFIGSGSLRRVLRKEALYRLEQLSFGCSRSLLACKLGKASAETPAYSEGDLLWKFRSASQAYLSG